MLEQVSEAMASRATSSKTTDDDKTCNTHRLTYVVMLVQVREGMTCWVTGSRTAHDDKM